jgi:hypothetical protein
VVHNKDSIKRGNVDDVRGLAKINACILSQTCQKKSGLDGCLVYQKRPNKLAG